MSATPVAIEGRTRASGRTAEPLRLAAGVILVAGLGLLVLAATLTLLVARERVPAAGHPGISHQLIRLGAMTPLLPLGALMLARLPRNAIGWLLCGTALGTALSVAAQEYATYSHFVDRLPAEPWLGWVGQWAPGSMLGLVTVAPLLFPTGRLPSRRWRPALWLGIGALVLLALQGLTAPPEDLKFLDNPIFATGFLHNVSDAGGIGWFLMLPAAVAGVAALFVRRRTATGEVREQLRLLARATVVLTLAFTACLIGSFVAPRALDVGATAAFLSLGFLAGTMAVAILRHRLQCGADSHPARIDTVAVEVPLEDAGNLVLVGE